MSLHTSPIRISGAAGDVWSCVFGIVLIAIVFTLQGCGGGGGGGRAAVPVPVADSEGLLFVGITDAEGDFLSYKVSVLSLLLENTNGDTVETLPLATEIDFTELTEVTEFLTIATVPAGTYASVTLTLDYTDAEIVVQDDEGNPQVANVVDQDGNPIGEFDVRLRLTTSDVIRIAPGIPAAFSLDFDLDASNTIDLTTAPPTVTVEPFLLAMPELERDRAHRARGVLAHVNEAEQEITLKVRPFRHRDGDFGRFTFNVDDDTQYEIDGIGYTGATGLTVMADLTENTPVIAGVMVTDAGFLAHTVLAGTSVPWVDADVVKGVVSARVDDTLTVRGARIEFANGTSVFRGTFRVLLGEMTTVTALGLDNADLDKDSISVGQRVVVFGDLLDDAASADSGATIDATEGRVRMQMNHLVGSVAQVQPFAVAMFSLNGRRPDVYDFSGTGITPDDDSDPSFYEVDTGALGLGNLVAGDLVRVLGIVNRFGFAPPDYLARTVIDVNTDDRAAALRVHWPEPTANPFVAIEPARIDLDLSESRAVLKIEGVPLSTTNPLENLALVAPDGGKGLYAVKIAGNGEIHLFRHFSDLVDELVRQLDDGMLLHRIGAHGRYNNDLEELTSGRASFEFRMPTSAQG